MLVQCENQENPRVTPALKVRIWEITDRSQAYVALQEFTASISEYKRTAKQRKSHLVNSAIFPPVLIVFCSGIACTEAFAFVIPPQHVNKSTKRCPLDFTKDERRKFTISSVRWCFQKKKKRNKPGAQYGIVSHNQRQIKINYPHSHSRRNMLSTAGCEDAHCGIMMFRRVELFSNKKKKKKGEVMGGLAVLALSKMALQNTLIFVWWCNSAGPLWRISIEHGNDSRAFSKVIPGAKVCLFNIYTKSVFKTEHS